MLTLVTSYFSGDIIIINEPEPEPVVVTKESPPDSELNVAAVDHTPAVAHAIKLLTDQIDILKQNSRGIQTTS